MYRADGFLAPCRDDEKCGINAEATASQLCHCPGHKCNGFFQKGYCQRFSTCRYLDKIYCYRSISFKKPSDEFFQYILNDLNMDRSQIIFVGDNLEKDIKGANDFGLRTVLFDRNSTETIQNRLCQTIHDLKELPDCLQNGF